MSGFGIGRVDENVWEEGFRLSIVAGGVLLCLRVDAGVHEHGGALLDGVLLLIFECGGCAWRFRERSKTNLHAHAQHPPPTHMATTIHRFPPKRKKVKTHRPPQLVEDGAKHGRERHGGQRAQPVGEHVAARLLPLLFCLFVLLV